MARTKSKVETAAVEETEKKHGGARPGAGRPTLYGKPLDARFSVRVDDEQAHAISKWCVENGVNVLSLFREAGLEAAGAKRLGVGVDALIGKTKKVKPMEKGGIPMIRCTSEQDMAIRDYCKANGVDVATFVREAVLARCGLSRLGIAGTLAEAQATAAKLSKALGG